jgi:hypothetical protein
LRDQAVARGPVVRPTVKIVLMRSARLILAAAVCFTLRAHAADLARGEVGGWDVANVPSPNGAYRVTTRLNADSDFTTLVLQHGARKRVLLKFIRSGDVVWSPDSRFLIFVDQRVEEDRIRVFSIGERVTELRWIERIMRQTVESQIPGSELIFYNLEFLRFDGPSTFSIKCFVEFFPPGIKESPADGFYEHFKIDLKHGVVTHGKRIPVD